MVVADAVRCHGDNAVGRHGYGGDVRGVRAAGVIARRLRCHSNACMATVVWETVLTEREKQTLKCNT